MLRFAEEIILILLDDEDGKFVNVPRWSLNYALAGGVLMDLAMENRIDTDIENLMLIDSTPVGDSHARPGAGRDSGGGTEGHPFLARTHRREGSRDPGGGADPAGGRAASWNGRTTVLCGCSGLGVTP